MSDLGPRGWFEYVSEKGTTYNYYGRVADMTAVSNTPAAKDANPPLPKRLKPRHLWFVNSAGLLRRKIVIGSSSNTLWTNPGTINVSSDTWSNTGRVGEKTIGTVKE